ARDRAVGARAGRERGGLRERLGPCDGGGDRGPPSRPGAARRPAASSTASSRPYPRSPSPRERAGRSRRPLHRFDPIKPRIRSDTATQPVTNPRSEDDPFGELVVRARAGDPDAFRRLARGVYGRIHRWALGRTGSPDDADDVAQTVLVRLHLKLGEYRGGRFTSWLYRITASVAEELRRKRDRRVR